jgi:predicted Zn finger-like uncharacterized protein
MKISCQSCPAKYTIADEKVVGKIVKIRCKKCGATIVVNGNEFQPSSGQDVEASTESWTVNVSDGDQRTMTPSEIQTEIAAGVINDETYCWKDGMADWLPLREIDELAGLLPADGGSAAPPLFSGAPLENDFGGGALGGGFTSPSVHPEPLAAAPAAARRVGGRGASGDLFGGNGGGEDLVTSGSLSSPPPGDSKLTGQRNENSVLFSLNALTSNGGGGPGPVSIENRTTAEGDGSGLIDIRALSQTMGVKPKDNGGKVDDIMNLSGGGAFGAALAAPALTAPVVHHSTMSASENSGSGSNKNVLIAGIIGGCLLLGVVAVGAMFAFKSDPQPVAQRDPGPALTVAPSLPPATTPETPPVVAAVDPGTVAAATNAGGGATSAATKPGTKPGAPAGVAAGGGATAKPEEKPVEKPAEKPKGTLAEEMAKVGGGGGGDSKPAAPAGGTAPFDRGAAGAAMSAAAGQAQSCKKPDGPTGGGHIKVTFAPNGSVSSAVADTPPYQGTPVGGCVAAKFRAIHIAPFAGDAQGAGKSFTIN